MVQAAHCSTHLSFVDIFKLGVYDSVSFNI